MHSAARRRAPSSSHRRATYSGNPEKRCGRPRYRTVAPVKPRSPARRDRAHPAIRAAKPTQADAQNRDVFLLRQADAILLRWHLGRAGTQDRMWCARSSYDNRSRPGFEPVSRMMQRNLKIAERRPVLECRRYAIRIPQISSQRPACAGLTAWNVATSSTATGRTTKTTLRGCPSWILIEPCAWPRSFHSGVFWRKSGPGP